MTTLLLAGLSNALLASAIAALAFAAGRLWKKQPVLAHALWLLVLIKLLTPPVVSVPFEWTVTREIAAAPREPRFVASNGSLARPVIYGDAPYLGQQTFEIPPMSNTRETTFKEGLLDPETGKPMLVIEVKPPTAKRSLPVEVKPNSVLQTNDAMASAAAEMRIAEIDVPSPPRNEVSFPWRSLTLAAWLCGAAGWLTFAGWRIARFHRLLRNSSVPPAVFQAEFDTIARRMGFRRPSKLRLLPGAVTPLVWAVGRATIYFPAELLNQLASPQRETLFVHELAHLKRRDHWVRWVELFAVSLYWWLPIAWIARRQLQRVEEECCDGWVVDVLPGAAKSYASALLDTIDFLAEGRPAPALASGVGQVPSIQKRLLMILHDTPRRRHTLVTRLAAAVCALTILPLAPTLAQRIVEIEKADDNPTANLSPAIEDDKLPALVTPFEPFAYERRSTSLQPPKSNWWALAVSPDGQTIVSTLGRGDGHPGEIVFWDVGTGKVKRTVKEAGPVRSFAFSPDGKFFATGSFDNAVRIHDTETGMLLAYGHSTSGGHTSGVNAVSFNGDGTLLASAGLDNTVRLWDVAAAVKRERPNDGNPSHTIQAIGVFQGHPQPVLSVAFAKDGKTLLTGCRDGVARLFDVPKPGPNGGRFTVKQERLALKGHANAVETVAISSDGKMFATGSWDNTAKLWDANGNALFTLQGHSRGVLALAFSKDGKLLATVSGDENSIVPGEIKLWETASGKKVADLGQHKHLVRSVAFSADEATVWSLGRDGTLQGWPVRDAAAVRTLVDTEHADDSDQAILAIALAADGKTLAVAGDSKNITLWDVEKKAIIGKLQGHTDVVNGVAFSPDGRTLASASNDKTIKLWDVASQKLLHTLKGHTNWVFSVAFSLDGARIASGSYDKTVRIWDVASQSEKTVFRGHTAAVRSVAFSPLGDYLASGSSDRTVRLWPLKGAKDPIVLRGHKGTIRSIAYSPDGSAVASGAEDKMIKIWGIADAAEILQIGPTLDMVGGIAYSPRGSMIVSGSWNGSTQVWDAHSGKQRANLGGHADAVVSVTVSADAQTLVTASLDRTIRLWPATPPPPAAELTFIGHSAALWSIAVSPDRKTVATAGKDGAIHLWDAETTKPLGVLPGHTGGVTHLCYSSDGRYLLSAGKDRCARVWDVESRGEMRALAPHNGDVTRAIFSPNGQIVATASSDKLVRLFDAANGNLIKVLSGHEATVSALAFNKDGSQLASGGNDKAMILWNVATGAVIQRTPTNPNLGQVHGVAFTPDGKYIALAHNQDYRQPVDDDPGEPQWRNVHLWSIEKGAVVEPNSTFQHSDWVTALAFSADGRTMITASRDGIVRFWELVSRRLIQSFRAHQANIAAIALSSDGGALFTAGDDRLARRWSALPLMPLTERARMTGQAGQVWFSALSPDGKLMAIGADDKIVRLRSAVPGASVMLQGKSGAAFSVVFSPDGKFVVSGHESGQIRVADPATGKELTYLDAKNQRVWGLAFSKDGKYLVAATGEWADKSPGRVIVWNTANWKMRHELDGHADLVFSVTVSPDGRHAATGSRDNTVRIWDIIDGKLLQTLNLHTGAVRSVAWSSDGKTLASAGFDNRLILWDTQTWKDRIVHSFPDKGLCRVAFAPDDKTLAVAYNLPDSKVGHVLLCDPATATVKHTLSGHTGQLLGLAFSPDGSMLVTTGGRHGNGNTAPDELVEVNNGIPVAGDRQGKQAEIKCWHVPSGQKLADLTGHQFWVEGVAFSRDGRQIATAGGNEGQPGEVRVWDAAGIQHGASLKGHESGLSHGAFNHDGSLLATCGFDKRVIIWDVKKALAVGGWAPAGVAKHILRGHLMGVRKVRFSPDGKFVVSAGDDGAVKIWNAESGELVRSISAHSMSIYGMAISPDGKTIATSAGDWKNHKHGEIKLWDFATGHEKVRLPDQTREVWDVAFSVDGKKLITAQGGDVQIKIWDVATSRVIKKLQTPVAPRSIAVTRDGRHLAVGLNNGQVRIWDTTNWQEISLLDAHGQKQNVFDVAFSPDADVLITAGGDQTAGVWTMPTRTKK